jgi:cytoskeletal protein CcmA (bactofilin family)
MFKLSSLWSRRAPSPAKTTPSLADSLKITSVIAKSAGFYGNLELSEGVKIDGIVHGNVTIDGDGLLVISEGAVVEGDVTAKAAIISGRVAGHANVARLVLQPTATIDGELSYSMLKMAEGASVTGRMNRMENPQFAASNVTPLIQAAAAS